MLHYLRVSWKYIKCQKNGTSANWIPWETQNMYSTIFSMYESKSSSFNVNFSFGAYVVVFVHLLFKNKKWKRQNTGWYFEKYMHSFVFLWFLWIIISFLFCKAIVQKFKPITKITRCIQVTNLWTCLSEYWYCKIRYDIEFNYVEPCCKNIFQRLS